MTLLAAVSALLGGIRADALRAVDALPTMLIQHLERGVLVPFAAAPVEEQLLRLPEVTGVSRRVWGLVPAPGEDAGGALAVLLGVDWGAPPPAGVLESGQWPAAGQRGVCVLGSGLAALGKLAPGGGFLARGPSGQAQRFTVAAVLHDDVAIHAANLVWVSEPDARDVLGLLDTETTELGVSFEDPALARGAAEVVARRFPELRLTERATLARLTDVVYRARGGAWSALWVVLLAVAPALAVALGLDVAASERREMGVLKALGWSSRMLIVSRLWEAFFIGAGATGVGLVAGLTWAALGASGLRGFFTGWAELYADVNIPVALEPGALFSILALGTLPLMAAAAWPAWRVATQPADAAMRE
jgi:ABC-type lipoprotein release transport system permease subunit